MKNQINSQKFLKSTTSDIAKKVFFIKSIGIAIFFVALLSSSSFAQNCSLTLHAKNNIESVNSEGRIYFMTLQNNTNEEVSVNLQISNTKSDKNPDMTLSAQNVDLIGQITNTEGQEIKNKLVLTSKQTIEFQVRVKVPQGTQIERWNNLLLVATSEKCPNYSTSLTLYTFIPNPTEK